MPWRDIAVIAGFPRDVFTRLRARFNSQSVKILGSPAPRLDSDPLYSVGAVGAMLGQVVESRKAAGDARFEPRRIFALYVGSCDGERFAAAFDFFAFTLRLGSDGNVSWRNDRAAAERAIEEALRRAEKITNQLKSEITDRRQSPLSLPPRNFEHPSVGMEIASAYKQFRMSGTDPSSLQGLPAPSLFQRKELRGQAFHGRAPRGSFYVDARGLVFPPHIGHGDAPPGVLEFRQRYRFGVWARDGRLHFDVQYRRPRRLQHEEMHCACGHCGGRRVLVTGSHANVGLNDVVWTPDGLKRPVSE